MKNRGFTLIEAIGMLVLLGILTALIGPKIAGGIEAVRVNGAIQKLISDIRYVRELAMSYHQTYGVEFDAAQNSYQLFQINGINKTVLADPHSNQAVAVDFDTIPQFTGVQIGAVSTCQGTCSTEEIRVDSFGRPYDGNGIALASNATVTLQAGGSYRTVQIVPDTAYCYLT